MSFVSNMIVYAIIKTLTTSWTKLDAYKYGLIDEKGKRTKKVAETKEEKNSINGFNRFIFNIKRILDKIPGGKFTSYAAAALLLLKEEYNLTDNDMKMITEEVEASMNTTDSTGTTASAENMGPTKIEPDEIWSEYAVFNVDPGTYYKNLRPKDKYKRWLKTLAIDEDMTDFGENSRIYEFQKQNPKTGIIIRQEGTNKMRVIREKKQ